MAIPNPIFAELENNDPLLDKYETSKLYSVPFFVTLLAWKKLYCVALASAENLNKVPDAMRSSTAC